MANTPKLILNQKSKLIATDNLLKSDDVDSIIKNLETMYLGYVGSRLAEEMDWRNNEIIAMLYLNLNKFFQGIDKDKCADKEFIKEYQRMYYFIVLSGMADKYKLFETQYKTVDLDAYDEKLKAIHLEAKYFIIHTN